MTDVEFATTAQMVLGDGWRPGEGLLTAESECERYVLEYDPSAFAGMPWLVGLKAGPNSWTGVRAFAAPSRAAGYVVEVRGGAVVLGGGGRG